MTTKSIEAGDLTIHYAETGEGPPLILLHGGLANADMSWNQSTPVLAPHFCVLAPDSRGHGRTNNPAGHLAYDQMADDVVAFAAAVGADKPMVFGYSDGGQIALELALRHPDFAKAYVFGGTVSERTQSYLDGLRKWGFLAPGEVDIATLQQEFGDFFDVIQQAHQGNGEPEYWRKMLPQISTLWIEVPSYSLEQLGTIEQPSLVIMGDRDDMAGEHQSTRLYRALPNGELAIIPNADHGAIAKDLFWSVVLDFLKRHVDS